MSLLLLDVFIGAGVSSFVGYVFIGAGVSSFVGYVFIGAGVSSFVGFVFIWGWWLFFFGLLLSCLAYIKEYHSFHLCDQSEFVCFSH